MRRNQPVVLGIDPGIASLRRRGESTLRAGRGLLVGLLVVANVLAHAVLLTVPGAFPDVAALVTLGVLLGQVGAVTAWGVMGRLFWLARWATLLAVITVLAGVFAQRAALGAAECLGVLLMQMAMIAAPLVVLRVAGLRVVTPLDAAEVSPPSARVWKYSIGSLFALTTGSAIAAALFRASSFPVEHALIAIAYCAAFALAPLVVLASFPLRRVGLGMVGSLALAPAFGAAAGALEGISDRVAWITLVEAVVVALVVGVSRLCGYRARWTARSAGFPGTRHPPD